MDYTYLLGLAVILLSTKLFGLATEKIHMPQVVGALLAGILLGPSGLGILENEGDVLAFDKAFLGKTGDETGIAVIQRRMCGKLRHTDGDHIVSHGGGGEGEQHCDSHKQGNDLAGDGGLRHDGVPSFLFSSHLVSSLE